MAQMRYGGADGRLDIGLRSGDLRRRAVARLSRRRSRGMRGRQAREPAFREPVRHGREVRRRDPSRGGHRAYEAISGREPMSAEAVADLRLYDYLPYKGRPKISWPGGAQIAVWIAPNVEFYEYAPPTNPQRTPWARPLPDVLAYSHRDY